MKRTAALFALLCGCRMSCLAPAADLLERPIAAELASAPAEPATTYDHAVFDGLLRRHVRSAEARVDYAGLAADRAQLDAYVARLAAADLGSLAVAERKALLINAYNAFTLVLILDNYPGVRSIRDLPSPWKARRWRLGGHTVSLDDIEHGLLRPLYADPRIHFAVNCASVGCPPLATSAYNGAQLDEQLEDAARTTLTNARYARVEGTKLYLTAIMDWYGGDFVGAGANPRADSISEFAGRYLAGVPAGATVEFLEYDWRLNDVTR